MKQRSFILQKMMTAGAAIMMSAALLCGCGAQETIGEFEAYAQSVESITLADDVRIVALGEATHGNKEFQELKLDVFAHLVETTNVRGFALEGDFGGCAVANDYILYGEGSVQEAVKALGFQIYRTDQMLELVQWMHDYNQQAADDDKVRFYGFDMQRDMLSIGLVKEFYLAVDTDKAQDYSGQFDTFYGMEEYSFDAADLPAMEQLLNTILTDLEESRSTYTDKAGEEKYAYALQAVKCLLQNVELHGAGGNYSQIRDKYMAENTKWILDREENIHGTRLMISGHNGHVAKAVNSTYTNMGYYLYTEMGESYHVIGTDFYNTTCNIADSEGRGDYEFCSEDPLAKAIEGMEGNIYYLDFEAAQASEELSGMINNAMKTGSLGESYSPIMKMVKSSYQLNIAPGTLYDGMILVYEATPIEVWDYMESKN